MMLQAHLSRVLYLVDAPAQELGCGASGHGAGHTDLALTADLCTRDRTVGLHYVADHAGGQKSPDHTYLGQVVLLHQVVQHRGKDSAAATGRGRHDLAASGVLLADREGVCDGKRIATDGTAEVAGLGVVLGGLPLELESSRKHALVVQAALYGDLHRLPDLGDVVYDPLPLDLQHDLPDLQSFAAAVLQELREGAAPVGRVYIHGAEVVVLLGDDAPSTCRIVGLRCHLDAVVVQTADRDRIGMERLELVGEPAYLDAPVELVGRLPDRLVGQVTLPGGGEGAVQLGDVASALPMTRAEALHGGTGPHCMR